MSLLNIKTVDSVQVLEDGSLSIKENAQTIDTVANKIISSVPNTFTLTPGTPITGLDSKIVAVANSVWTPEVVKKFKDKQAS